MEESDIEPIGRGLSVRCYLATTGKSGEPHVVPVHPGWEGSTIWIMTGRSDENGCREGIVLVCPSRQPHGDEHGPSSASP